MSIPAVMIAAPQGRSGKTTLSIGLCAALRKKGLKVKPFKKGPDYIDPSWLSAAAGTACSNLDPFLFTEKTLHKAYSRGCEGSDIVVVEASMGLYDSIQEDGRGSSAWLARLLNIPVILVVNAARMTRSVAALVSGYLNFEPGTPIAGVILNNVAGDRHRGKLVSAIEAHCKIPVLGCLPRSNGIALKERHLGIVPFTEQPDPGRLVNRICALVEDNVDLDPIMTIAAGNTASGSSQLIDKIEPERIYSIHLNRFYQSSSESHAEEKVNIAVLYDRAFSFYYPENLAALASAGAKLVYLNSFKDSLPAAIHGLYIGGGFPELYAGELEANSALRAQVADAARDNLPVYAECAGLMYLSRALVKEGRSYSMAGLLETEVRMTGEPQAHGYAEVEVLEGNPYFKAGTLLKGHEFHYSRLRPADGLNYTFKLRRGHGMDGRSDGIVYRNALATYMHLHALSVPGWAGDFVKLALSHKIEPLKTAV